MNMYNILNNLNTGDLILFQGKHSFISSLINMFTNSRWTHIGVVLKNPKCIDTQLKGLYLWESGEEEFPDSENNKYKYGVQIVDLKEKIAFFGDSITQSGNQNGGYVDLLRRELNKEQPHAAIIPAGISGHKVPDLLARIDRDVINKKATVVFVYILMYLHTALTAFSLFSCNVLYG